MSPQRNRSGIVLKRLCDYVLSTEIRFREVSRLEIWKDHGLPDLRGFTPQLRTVNIYSSQKDFLKFLKNPSVAKAEKYLWLLHDICHIIFYDYITVHLGKKSWADPARFLEGHIASEAFAVLFLDYHFLPMAALGGLASHYTKKDWSGFQRKNRLLPDANSHDFCHELVSLYLTGNDRTLSPTDTDIDADTDTDTRTPTHNHSAASKKFDRWFGHEKRYASKQRHYVLSWLEDLHNRKSSAKEAVLSKSFVSEAVWDMIEILSVREHADYENFRNLAQKALGSTKINLFKAYPKYKASRPRQFDFRFTAIDSLKKNEVKNFLKEKSPPSSSRLFFFWQILSTFPPTVFTKKELGSIRALAKSAQAPIIDPQAWKQVEDLVASHFQNFEWQADTTSLSTFFLP